MFCKKFEPLMIGILTVLSKFTFSGSIPLDLSPPHQLPPREAQALQPGHAFATSFTSRNDPAVCLLSRCLAPGCRAEPPGLPPAHQGPGYNAQSKSAALGWACDSALRLCPAPRSSPAAGGSPGWERGEGLGVWPARRHASAHIPLCPELCGLQLLSRSFHN